MRCGRDALVMSETRREEWRCAVFEGRGTLQVASTSGWKRLPQTGLVSATAKFLRSLSATCYVLSLPIGRDEFASSAMNDEFDDGMTKAVSST
jgi:hypothetical protein